MSETSLKPVLARLAQGETLDELDANLRQVVAMLLEDGPPRLDGEFVGTRPVAVG